MGNSKTGFTRFEAQVVPALLINCESWIGLKDTHNPHNHATIISGRIQQQSPTPAKDRDSKESTEDGRRHDPHEVQSGIKEIAVSKQDTDEG